MQHARNWIAGQWVDAESGATAESINPANGHVLGTFSNAAEADALAAIDAARQALNGSEWSHEPSCTVSPPSVRRTGVAS